VDRRAALSQILPERVIHVLADKTTNSVHHSDSARKCTIQLFLLRTVRQTKWQHISVEREARRKKTAFVTYLVVIMAALSLSLSISLSLSLSFIEMFSGEALHEGRSSSSLLLIKQYILLYGQHVELVVWLDQRDQKGTRERESERE
jgi:hypothetical protein